MGRVAGVGIIVFLVWMACTWFAWDGLSRHERTVKRALVNGLLATAVALAFAVVFFVVAGLLITAGYLIANGTVSWNDVF